MQLLEEETTLLVSHLTEMFEEIGNCSIMLQSLQKLPWEKIKAINVMIENLTAMKTANCSNVRYVFPSHSFKSF